MNQETINSIYSLLPESALTLSILSILLVSIFGKNTQKINYYILTCGIFLSLFLLVISFANEPRLLFSGLLAVDLYGWFIKIFISSAFLILLIIFKSEITSPEQCVLNALILAGALLSISSSNLIMMFASLEFVNIALFILLSGYRKIALKYFINSAFFSGLMLYGISLMYGLTGSFDYYLIRNVISSGEVNLLTLIFSTMLITAGFAFRLLLFPFGFIVPKIADNISVRHLAYILLLPVIASAGASGRFFLTIFIYPPALNGAVEIFKWQNLTALLSISSVLAGSLLLLRLTKLKQIVTFTTLIQAAFLFLPISVPSYHGVSIFLFNIFVFIINTLGIIICVNIIVNNNIHFVINKLKGAGRNNRFLYGCFILFLASSAGFPMTAGFIGKFYIYSAIFSGDYIIIGIIAVLCTMTLFYFTFNMAAIIFSNNEHPHKTYINPSYKILLLILLLLTVIFGICFQPLFELSKHSSKIIGL